MKTTYRHTVATYDHRWCCMGFSLHHNVNKMEYKYIGPVSKREIEQDGTQVEEEMRTKLEDEKLLFKNTF